MREPFAGRCSRLLGRARRKDCRAVLVTKGENVRYLSGFPGEDSWLVLSSRRPMLVTDSRFTEEAGRWCKGWEILARKGPIARETADILRSARLPAAFEAHHVSVETHRLLADRVRGRCRLIPTYGLVEGLRLCKDRSEVEAIRRSIRAAQAAFFDALGALRGDADESALAAGLEYEMRRHGAESAAFPTIVAAEPNSSMPHATPGSKRIYDSPSLLVDWGAKVGGYNSDLTRMVWRGKVVPQLVCICRVVRAAQRAALDAIRPGVAASRVDAVARRVISEAGFKDHFGHGLGHGVGLEIHEGPSLSPKSRDRLREGMVVTVEPGIYIPGVGGARVEDMVLVTAGGPEILTHVSRDPHRLGALAG